jgi:hypothetical protein
MLVTAREAQFQQALDRHERYGQSEKRIDAHQRKS